MAKAAISAKTFRFDQMATLINDRVENPAESGVERYVGLEHLDAESLRIRRWGEITDVESTKLRFQPDDIIFGKRRVYQRKVAVADFEGICSAHAMVLRAKPDVVLPEFLPFFMQTDQFMGRALGISVGSLSPTINWSALAREEFVLPSIEEQQRLAATLFAMDRAAHRIEDLAKSLAQIEASIIDSFLEEHGNACRFGDIIVSATYGTSARSTNDGSGVPVLGVPNVRRGHLSVAEFNTVELSDAEVARYILATGDLLLVRTNGNPEYVGRCVSVGELPQPFVYASYLIRIRVDQKRLLSPFVTAVINAPSIRRVLRATVRSSAGNYNINTDELKNLFIPVPSLAEQKALLRHLDVLRSQREQVEARLAQLIAMRRSVLEAAAHEL
jgi:type I restriction enzyme, S subunit